MHSEEFPDALLFCSFSKKEDARKLHYVFDTGSSGIRPRARFSGKYGSFELPVKLGMDPAVFIWCGKFIKKS